VGRRGAVIARIRTLRAQADGVAPCGGLVFSPWRPIFTQTLDTPTKEEYAVTIHAGKKIAGLAGMLIAGAFALSFSGCGKVHNTATSPDSPSTTTSTTTSATSADVTPSFTVSSSGAHLSRSVTGPGSISFNVKGISASDANGLDNHNIAFGYDSKGYYGGSANSDGSSGNGFEFELRNQKLKCFGTDGVLMGSEGKRYGVPWNPSLTYSVKIEWTATNVILTVNGAVVENKPGKVANAFTLGIGYPPKVREGFAGAVYTDIHWPTGSTPL
jgi:hypothetical protein